MSKSPSQHRIEFAATIFVRECLRQYLKLHPGTKPEDVPMRALCDYPKREQMALQRAVEKAIEASAGMDDAYRVFLQTKLERVQSGG